MNYLRVFIDILSVLADVVQLTQFIQPLLM